MDDKLKIIKQNVKKAGARPVILMIIVPLLFCVFAVAVVNAFLKKQYQMIHYEDTIRSSDLSADFMPYLDSADILVEAAADGVDVVAADIDLTTFQRLTEDIARESGDHEVMVVDIDGNVITCSFPEDLGVNFATDPHPDRKTFYENWKKNEKNSFVTVFDGKRYLVSPQTIKFGWTAFTFTDVDALSVQCYWHYHFCNSPDLTHSCNCIQKS